MIILPAIDIKDGQCVRLTRGDFATTEKVAADPLEPLCPFRKRGRSGSTWWTLTERKRASEKQSDFLKVVQNTGLKVRTGGGIRTMESVDYYLEQGISPRDHRFGRHLGEIRSLGQGCGEEIRRQDRGGDRRQNAWFSGDGWFGQRITYLALAKKMEDAGVEMHHFYRHSKDGTLSGPNLEQLGRIRRCGLLRYHRSGGSIPSGISPP
jgi:phosphoribosylformimino-5-aminoimidazole carboxamide ribotide isomerase